MPITYRIDPLDERLTATVAGDLTFHDLRATLGVMVRDPDYNPRLDRLWDLREAHTKLSGDEMRQIAASVRDDVGGNRVAIVASSDITYGMARMYSVLVEEAGIYVRPFRTLEGATTWLQEMRQACTAREDLSLPQAS